MIILAILALIGAIAFTLFVLYANSMRSSPGAFVGKGLLLVTWGLVFALWLAWGVDKALATELRLVPKPLLERSHTPPPLPPEITIGRSQLSFPPFGAFTLQYMHRRWARLCKGGGRYQAMAEAYERGLPSPCK